MQQTRMERETGSIFKNYQLLQQEMEPTSNSILNNINSSLGASQSSNGTGGENEHTEMNVTTTTSNACTGGGGGGGTFNLSLPGLGLEQRMIDFLNEGSFNFNFFRILENNKN